MNVELNHFYNCDCMELLKSLPDKFVDLAIVDPPYGHDSEDSKETGIHMHGRGRNRKYKDIIINAERTGGQWAKKYGTKINKWDKAPEKEYFDELMRVSKNQIIWGGNYFELPATRCFLVWRKLTISENFTMAMCEYAWTSFNENAKLFECAPQDKERFHPTQKPVKLYEWILNRYANKGDIILDTHCGSASSLVACHKLGFDYIGCELDETYYQLANERLEAEKVQLKFEM